MQLKLSLEAYFPVRAKCSNPGAVGPPLGNFLSVICAQKIQRHQCLPVTIIFHWGDKAIALGALYMEFVWEYFLQKGFFLLAKPRLFSYERNPY